MFGHVRKLGFGICAVVCCGLPMLVIAGLVSVTAALLGGMALASTALVIFLTWAVAVQKLPAVDQRVRRATMVLGAVSGFAGLYALWSDSISTGRPLVVAGIALLTCTALGVLADMQKTAGPSRLADGTTSPTNP